MSEDLGLAGIEHNHPVLLRLVGAFVDGELPPALRDRVEAHLVGCEECRTEAQTQVGVRTRLGASAGTLRAVSPALRERLLAELESVAILATEAGSAEHEPERPEPGARRRLALAGATTGWLVAAGLALLLWRRPAPAGGGTMAMSMRPTLTVTVDSAPDPIVDGAMQDFRRVTGADLPVGMSLDSLQSQLAFSLPALKSPHMQLVAAWRTRIDGESAGALAYICHNRLVLQYVVSDEAFFRLARIRQAVASTGLYAARSGQVHAVAWPSSGSGSFLVGEFSAPELAAMRL